MWSKFRKWIDEALDNPTVHRVLKVGGGLVVASLGIPLLIWPTELGMGIFTVLVTIFTFLLGVGWILRGFNWTYQGLRG